MHFVCIYRYIVWHYSTECNFVYKFYTKFFTLSYNDLRSLKVNLCVLNQASCGPSQTGFPRDLTANPIGEKHVVLNWSNDNVDVMYYVFYEYSNGTVHAGTTKSKVMDVTDLSPNTTYRMIVVADNGIAGNEEDRSVSISVTTNSTGMLSEHCNVYSDQTFNNCAACIHYCWNLSFIVLHIHSTHRYHTYIT